MMKTRRNGDAVAIYCGVMGCETVYADVFADRVLVHSFHYGRTHSAPFHADQFAEMVRLAYNETPANLECVCPSLTCGAVEPGQIVLESQHQIRTATGKARAVHRNVWRAEEIEQISTWLGLIGDTMPTVEIDSVRVEKVG